MDRRWTKRAAAAALLAIALAGCESGPGTVEGPGEEGLGESLTGRSITVYMASSPAADAIRDLLPQFQALTGQQVDLTPFSNEQLSQRLSVQFAAGSTVPDVLMLRPLEELRAFAKNGWLEPLDGYAELDAEYNVADFSPAAIDSVTADGSVYAIPISTEQQILYFRKDLLKKAGLSVPRTLDELEAAAGLLHDPSAGLYGFVARGQRNALVTQLSSFLYAEGGDFLQGGQAALHTPEAIRGFERYVTLLRRYGPPSVFNMGWQQASGLFAQGKAAFYTDASAIYSIAIGSEQSPVKDKVGVALFPAGSAGHRPYHVTAWGLAMNAGSPRKEAAWRFIRWATSQEVVLRSQQKGNPGARESVWQSPEGVSGFPASYIEVVSESMRVGVGHDRPQVVRVKEARDIVGNVVVRGLLGESVAEAAERANEELQALLDKENGP